MVEEKKNPLGEEQINKLLRQFAVPSIVSMLVGSLYNIVDQFFIGQSIGELGNAATNIAFPLSICCVAIGLVFGAGGAAAFNISMGGGKREQAVRYLGNAVAMLVICGITLSLVTHGFLEQMLRFFGSPENVLEYAKTYTRITAFGFPFAILTTGGAHLIRADGRPKVSMICNMTGAILNIFLDALFVFGFQWGMAGAALATVIGQVVSGMLVIWYLSHCKTVTLIKSYLVPKANQVKRIMSLGIAPFSNQVSMLIIQIVMNKSLKYYGSVSVYGEAIPIACAGIISKVNMLFMSFVIGTSQGLQPIASFNYGAKQYARVKEAYLKAIRVGAIMALLAFLMFQIFPRQIISLFGNGSEEYYNFAIRYFRIYMFFTFANFIQPITSNFFTAIGKPKRGSFLALTRQILFLLPLLVVFPLLMGIDGIMYAGPVADGMAAVITTVMVCMELKRKEYNVKM